MSLPQISIVIPLFNEEESFHLLVGRLKKLLSGNSLRIEILLIDDGSSDSTPKLIEHACKEDLQFRGIILSRNFGHQAALSCGLTAVTCTDAVFIIDADLQDPPELLNSFYSYYEKGFDVVYGIRKKRKETVFKRTAYYMFYRLLDRITKLPIPVDSGDFSLISRKVVDILNEMPEESRYIRGMRTWIGFDQVGVEYEREERSAGKTKYSLSKLFKLAYDGIFNFSEFPIKFITKIGFFTIAISFFYLVYNIIKKFILGQPIPSGFVGLLFIVTLFSGVQLISLGVLGEYISRTFIQVKKRPLFIIKKKIEASS